MSGGKVPLSNQRSNGHGMSLGPKMLSIQGAAMFVGLVSVPFCTNDCAPTGDALDVLLRLEALGVTRLEKRRTRSRSWVSGLSSKPRPCLMVVKRPGR